LGLLVQKSNAGERISKFFIEKKIFYSIDFLPAISGQYRDDFFYTAANKYTNEILLPVNPVIHCRRVFH
jgi:hypothetical protein